MKLGMIELGRMGTNVVRHLLSDLRYEFGGYQEKSNDSKKDDS